MHRQVSQLLSTQVFVYLCDFTISFIVCPAVRNFTIFAPTDAAIQAASSSGQLDYATLFAKNKTLLTGLVSYHVVPQYAFSKPGKNTNNMETLLGQVGLRLGFTLAFRSRFRLAFRLGYMLAFRLAFRVSGLGFSWLLAVECLKWAIIQSGSTHIPFLYQPHVTCSTTWIEPLHAWVSNSNSIIATLQGTGAAACNKPTISWRADGFVYGGAGTAKVATPPSKGCQALIYPIDSVLQPCCKPLLQLLQGGDEGDGLMAGVPTNSSQGKAYGAVIQKLKVNWGYSHAIKRAAKCLSFIMCCKDHDGCVNVCKQSWTYFVCQVFDEMNLLEMSIQLVYCNSNYTCILCLLVCLPELCCIADEQYQTCIS